MVVNLKKRIESGPLSTLFVCLAFCGAAVGCNDSAATESLDFVDASLASFGCEQECSLQILSPCTCGTDDPCGWQNDNTCDRKCLFNDIVTEMFDDAQDCPGLCDGACESGYYTPCSCAAADPCGWANDGDCDIFCTEDNRVDVMFNDSYDCPDVWRDGGI